MSKNAINAPFRVVPYAYNAKKIINLPQINNASLLFALYNIVINVLLLAALNVLNAHSVMNLQTINRVSQLYVLCKIVGNVQPLVVVSA